MTKIFSFFKTEKLNSVTLQIRLNNGASNNRNAAGVHEQLLDHINMHLKNINNFLM